jgi:hypothetical protein
MKIRIKAGTRVQNNSRGWDSVIFLFKEVLPSIENMLNPTTEIIKIKIVRVWS